MMNGKQIIACFIALFGAEAFSQSIDQPTPKDPETAAKQLQDAAECAQQIDPNDESMNYLIAAGGGVLEHYAAPGKPYVVLGVQSKKIVSYFDPTHNTPITITTLVHGSMNTVKDKLNLSTPLQTDVGTLSVRYSSSPGMIEITCTALQ